MKYIPRKYPLNNNQKYSKSQSIFCYKSPINAKCKIFNNSPSLTTGDSIKNIRVEESLKKYKNSNKALSINVLPQLDSLVFKDNLNSKNRKFDFFTPNKVSFLKNNDIKEEGIGNESFLEIELLWEELGITEEYKKEFELHLGSINNIKCKKMLLKLERNNLKKIKEALNKFSKEKLSRFNNIEILKKLNNDLKGKNIIDIGIQKELLFEIIDCIKAIRLNSINAIYSLIKVREVLACYSLDDKINLDKINKNFFFDNNYLLRMNSEVSFLKYSEIGKIFKKNEEEMLDTFITKYTDIKINEKEIISNTVTKDLMNEIYKCRYYIIQDNFLNNINMKKLLVIKNKNKNKGNKLMTSSNINFNKLRNNSKEVKLINLKKELGENYDNIFESKKQNFNLKINENKRLNFLKNNMKMKRIVIDRYYFNNNLYKINNDMALTQQNYNSELQKDELIKDEKKDKKYMDINLDFDDIFFQKKDLFDYKGNNNKIVEEKKVNNNNNDLDGNYENKINNKDFNKEENSKENNDKGKNKEIKDKKELDEENIVDIDYLENIKKIGNK